MAERRKKIEGIDYLNSKNLYEPFRSCHYVTIKDKTSGSKRHKTVELTTQQKLQHPIWPITTYKKKKNKTTSNKL